jgi:hypothetical protein
MNVLLRLKNGLDRLLANALIAAFFWFPHSCGCRKAQDSGQFTVSPSHSFGHLSWHSKGTPRIVILEDDNHCLHTLIVVVDELQHDLAMDKRSPAAASCRSDHRLGRRSELLHLSVFRSPVRSDRWLPDNMMQASCQPCPSPPNSVSHILMSLFFWPMSH